MNPVFWIRAVASDLRELNQYRTVLRNFVRAQLKVRYQGTVLGFAWALLNPLLTMVILAVVFSTLLNRPLRTFTIFLFSGLLPWQFLSDTVTNGASSLIRNQYLMRQIYVPKLLFPLSAMSVAVINMMLAMAALFLILQFIGAPILPQLILLPIGAILLITFTLGITLLLMTLNTFYRDITHMISVILRGWYFASPILYRPEDISSRNETVGSILQLNPMTHLLTIFHSIFIDGRWMGADVWLPAIAFAVGTLILGYAVFKINERKLIFRL